MEGKDEGRMMARESAADSAAPHWLAVCARDTKPNEDGLDVIGFSFSFPVQTFRPPGLQTFRSSVRSGVLAALLMTLHSAHSFLSESAVRTTVSSAIL